MTSVVDKLKAMQADWEVYSQLDDEVGLPQLPQGRYTAKVVKAELVESSNHKPMVHWDLLITEGEYTGRHLFKNSVIDPASKDNMKWLAHDLHILGLTVNKLHTLNTHLKKVLGLKLSATNGKSSVFFNTIITS